MLKILECDVDGVLLNIWEPVEKVLQQRHRNCGFTSDGRLVILDYSGYNEIDDYYDDEDWEEE